MNILFQVVSNLTGGLISDSTTLLTGLITVSFIIFAFDILMGSMGDKVRLSNSQSLRRRADEALMKRQLATRGSTEWHYHNRQFQRLINKSADLGL